MSLESIVNAAKTVSNAAGRIKDYVVDSVYATYNILRDAAKVPLFVPGLIDDLSQGLVTHSKNIYQAGLAIGGSIAISTALFSLAPSVYIPILAATNGLSYLRHRDAVHQLYDNTIGRIYRGFKGTVKSLMPQTNQATYAAQPI